ncbi:hypothetical protein [uncultured Nitrosomonas sp.]|uniref:hypothetical protein n=1 Tax=uncultured Nitrosomonas sp. TaxID=156424 RepID=UPI0026168940|nr:hypothetical protein [uncultured Nitrosomonas sp.]
MQITLISAVHCETAQLVKQSSKMQLLLPSKLKWHLDQHIFTVFANARGVKQFSILLSLPLLDRRASYRVAASASPPCNDKLRYDNEN